ncbi:magnesium-translocating P-type ATPase [Pedobacter sp. HMWF019]|uniref:magnesium-translocating P-type ATPase n=1 Tax=Pedobacter sp. HMWF019 TaxID=2056856 RepID=UPI000D3430B1|nr:magnesium-translocating P-type ATPase [Pedobacter sp. HMWF019]PTS96774.1 magnesium-translocating P-type ATPase [Pedobacter sp. HMWF019]
MRKATPTDQQFWNLSSQNALSSLSATAEGLDSHQASKRLEQYGTNTLKDNSGRSGLSLFLQQFKSPVTLLLIAAAVLSGLLGDVPDTIIIFVIVLISSFLGYWQEKGAANAVKELLKMVQLRCTILRDGKQQELPFEEVVPGDIVYLSAGDIVPGDALLLTSQELFADEAAFTGETYPVEKDCAVLPANTPLSKRSNALFMGSHIISGKASILIMQTGANTEFGKISAQLQTKIPETDFERGIRHFGYLLMEVTMLLVLIIFAANVLLHKPVLDSFLFSMALAVGLTPQLLPAIVSVNLATGAKRMAKQKVIVKRLSSIENLGSMTVLCSDKTGTITEGKVNLKDTLGVDGQHSDKVLEYAWLNAYLQQGFHNPIDEAISSGYKGNPDFKLQSEIPYDFIRKRLTVEVMHADLHIVITKGALNNILAVCSQVELASGHLEDIQKHTLLITKLYQEFSSNGFRTLGVAYKPWQGRKPFTRADEQGMVFIGFITLFDPPKAHIKETIRKLKELGVGLKIITGDNELVAKSLAFSVGLEEPGILTGPMIQKMNDAALRHKAQETDIFAEVEPNQKERIILMLKKAGHVVGFMGDGINDAPALHTADVGISVDTAVDVAKQAADIVLLDRDLNVLTEGVLEGRKTFTNTMKYIFMATSANFGNMFSMAGASLFLAFLPLLPKQILLTNLLTDFPEMAIATDRVDQMNLQRPQRWDFKFIKRFMITFGLLSSIFDYLTFGVLILLLHSDEKTFQTGWFTESVLSATLIVLVVRTRLPFFKSLPGKYLFMATLFILIFVLLIPLTPMASWFGFVKLPLSFYGWIFLIVALYMFSAELLKRWFYKKI